MRIYMQNRPEEMKATRYYQLILQEDLIDGWSLIAESGEQGRAGRQRRENFPEWDEALEKMMQLRDAQLRRGYRVMYIQGQPQSERGDDGAA